MLSQRPAGCGKYRVIGKRGLCKVYGSARLKGLLRVRLLQAIVVSAALAGLIEGCAGPHVIEGAVPMAPRAARTQQSCTAQWLAHRHTTQSAAKAFAKKCLHAQGAVEQQLDRKTVARKLAALIDADKRLTALEPSDVGAFCPGYMTQDRKGRAVFWRTLLVNLTGAESVYNTATAYWEADLGWYSIGLLQLSLADEERYRCGFRSEADITDPNRNLVCGVKVVTMLVAEDGMIGGGAGHEMKGIGAYWQNLRRPSKVRTELMNSTRAISQCRVAPRNS
jgi:hypothetical protein